MSKKLDIQKINNLVTEYKADPNCRGELWISRENVTEDERKLFIELVTNKKLDVRIEGGRL